MNEAERQKMKQRVHLGFVIVASCLLIAILADIFFNLI